MSNIIIKIHTLPFILDDRINATEWGKSVLKMLKHLCFLMKIIEFCKVHAYIHSATEREKNCLKDNFKTYAQKIIHLCFEMKNKKVLKSKYCRYFLFTKTGGKLLGNALPRLECAASVSTKIVISKLLHHCSLLNVVIVRKLS